MGINGLSRSIFIFVSFLVLGAFADVQARDFPQTMAVLGDSMSEGMLAGYSLEKRPSLATVAKVAWYASGKKDDERMSVFRKVFARKDLSWATGDDTQGLVQSHYLRLKKHSPELRAENFAVSGSASEELKSQVDELLKSEETNEKAFDYVIVMIGANDLAYTAKEEYVPAIRYIGNMETNFRRILDRESNRQILVVGLPAIHAVFEKSADFTAYQVLGEKVSCQAMRRDIYGKKTVFYPEDVENYEMTKTLISQYREGLAQLVERLQVDYPRAEFKLIKDYREPLNIRKALSIDCFHPSEWGQAELSEITWQLGFWPDVASEAFALWK